VLRPCCAIKSMATWQSSEIRVSILLEINVTLRFYFELPLVLIESDRGVPSVDKSINDSTCMRGKVLVQKHLNQVLKSNECKCRQWRLQHSGSAQVFDYGLYCRTQACLLCIFVPPPTSLIKAVNMGSFHWALSVSIFLFHVDLPHSFCRRPE